jgi:uncharacterized membrane protein YecN with MAPEG domain
MPFDLPAAQAAALWTGLLLILLLVLATRVTRMRRKHRVAEGDGGAPELVGAIRAFGNATEYVPALIAALAVLAIANANGLLVHIAGGAMFAGRLFHAIGLSRTAGVSMGRSIGTLITWITYVFTAVALLVYAIF